MKRPLVGPILSGFYFYAQTLQTMSQGYCMSNIRIFGWPVHNEEYLQKFTKFYPFLPLTGPQYRGQPLDICKLEFLFPKDASYQIWFKSVQWF